jgi:tungstate transport system substrate-binding protein
MRLRHGPGAQHRVLDDAYVLTDRGTWLSFKNRGEPRHAGRRRQAPVQPVRRDRREPAKHPHVKKDLAQAFADWVVSPEQSTTRAT